MVWYSCSLSAGVLQDLLCLKHSPDVSTEKDVLLLPPTPLPVCFLPGVSLVLGLPFSLFKYIMLLPSGLSIFCFFFFFANSLMWAPLYVILYFSLAVFKILSLSYFLTF